MHQRRMLTRVDTQHEEMLSRKSDSDFFCGWIRRRSQEEKSRRASLAGRAAAEIVKVSLHERDTLSPPNRTVVTMAFFSTKRGNSRSSPRLKAGGVEWFDQRQRSAHGLRFLPEI
jgi:hypothetical protein